MYGFSVLIKKADICSEYPFSLFLYWVYVEVDLEGFVWLL